MTELRATTFVTFDEAYERQWLPFVRLATLTTGSLAVAEDIVQEAFVALYRRWDVTEYPGDACASP
jgi:DNA-directed RNA polymerase specialized sigma24 family protein